MNERFEIEGEADPRDEIARLEERIDALADRVESCRKYGLAGWIAAILSGLALVPSFAAVYFGQPIYLIAALGVLIGGIVVAGSNRSTRQEAEAELSKVNARREALIGQLELRVVSDKDTVRTLH